nr:hypothetical protein [uncultured Sphingomonas sp.]
MRGLLLFWISATAWQLAPAAAGLPKRTPEPGYECKIDRRGDFGLIKTEFQIPDSGEKRAGYIRWDAGDGQFQNPWITAAFFRQKEGGYSLGHGYVSIMRHIWARGPGKKPGTLKLRLELTTNPIMGFPSSRMTGDIERSGGPFHIQLDWSDTSSLASGSSRLYLIARNSHREVVDQVNIDRTIFSRAEPHILAAFSEADRMMNNPRAFCEHKDDLGTDDIVLT